MCVAHGAVVTTSGNGRDCAIVYSLAPNRLSRWLAPLTNSATRQPAGDSCTACRFLGKGRLFARKSKLAPAALNARCFPRRPSTRLRRPHLRHAGYCRDPRPRSRASHHCLLGDAGSAFRVRSRCRRPAGQRADDRQSRRAATFGQWVFFSAELQTWRRRERATSGAIEVPRRLADLRYHMVPLVERSKLSRS